MIRFEHFALNLPEPRAVALWYVENLDCQIVFQLDEEPFTVFLGDQQGRVFWEFYNNPRAGYSPVANTDPLSYHLAFAVEDAEAVRTRVLAAGGAEFAEVRSESGSRLLMMRDPWGLGLQLCQRIPPFLPPVGGQP